MSEEALFTIEGPGLFVVRYRKPEDLTPARQDPLIAAMEAVPSHKPVGVVFDVGGEVRSVEMDVPNFWLTVTGRRELRLRAMAIASPSVGVRIAAKAFGLTTSVRKLPIAVQSFTDVFEAIRWVRTKLEDVEKEKAAR
jgi:hypothetical protein